VILEVVAPSRLRRCGPSIPALFAALLLCSSAPVAVQAAERKAGRPTRLEVSRMRAKLGYIPLQDGRARFTQPYDRGKLAELIALAAPSPPGRSSDGYLALLSSAVLFWNVPVADLRDFVHPVLLGFVERMDKELPADEDPLVAAEARRCIWNVEYALALAEREELRRSKKPLDAIDVRIAKLDLGAVEQAKATRVDYLGDLVSWCLRMNIAAAERKIAEVAKADPRSWRVHLAREELRIRRELEACKEDEQRVEVLKRAATDKDSPIPLQCWAVRALAGYPTNGAVRFLLDLYEKAAEERRFELGTEAQEALRVLGKLPKEGGRYDRTE